VTITAAPTREGGRGRFAALAVLAAAIAVGGFLGTVTARKPPRTVLQPAALAAEAAPAGSASSSWYCPGAPGPAVHAGTTELLLANAATRAVRVDVAVVDGQGSQRRRALELGPHAETGLVPAQVVDGSWLAARVLVAGGAVSATELVDGRIGRSVTPCASEVASRWYFASGSTREGSTLRVTLFNPTPDLSVVDLSFVTASGSTTPAPFQGLVVAPWALRVLTVGAYVQNQASIATVVVARSGAVVAAELQRYGPDGAGGVAFGLGAPAMSTLSDLPAVEDATGGSSELAVFNPSGLSEHVEVAVRLPSGPVQPFTQVLAPQSVWTLPTSEQLRIAMQEHYTVQVRASGPGVVVARVGAGTPHGPAPWWAQDVTVTGLQASAARSWVVAGPPVVPLTAATPPAAAHGRAASWRLALENPGRGTLRVVVTSWAGARRRRQVVQVPALDVATAVVPAGPAFVRADGAIAVMGDASPAGTVGVVGIPAVPLR
jgi:hypothetical protein